MGVRGRVKHYENPRETGESHSYPFIHLCDIQQILVEHPLECLMICKDCAWVGQPVKLQRPKEPDPVCTPIRMVTIKKDVETLESCTLLVGV